MKLGIIGTGHVGEIVAYTAAFRGSVTEIMLNDKDEQKAKSQAMDLNDARSFMPKDIKISHGSYEDLADSDIIVISCGKLPESNDRLDELKMNKVEVSNFIPRIMKAGFDGIFVVVTNPVDVITYHVYKLSGLPANRVIGSGTALDSARLSIVIANKLGISPKSVNATVLGEHGESQFSAWSQVRIGNESIDKYEKDHPELFKNFDRDEIEDETRRRGWEIIIGKKSTQSGIGNTVNNIIDAIVHDEKKFINASALLNGEYGLKDLYISSQIVVGKDGIEDVLELDLTEDELKRYKSTAKIIKDHIETL